MKLIKTLLAAAAVLGLMIALGGCTEPGAQVFQGTCVSYDAKVKRLILKNDEPKLNPVTKTVDRVTFEVARAKIGITPVPGDKIRVAFRLKGKAFVASKVMNVTRQDLRKK